MEIDRSILNLAHHRSKKRIRDLGEVFTPDKYVYEMLDMIDQSVWSDTSTVFFEPTCGHGNFVSAIVQRRLNSFLEKGEKEKNPKFYTLANTLNNLWAIDIDAQNIELCRRRVWEIAVNFLFNCQVENFSPTTISKKDKVFLAHILCCIKWQIQENEALSCLADDPKKAKENAKKMLVSRKWLAQNGHHPIDFDLSWVEYFDTLKSNKIVPPEYTRSFKFLNSLPKRGAFRDFNFAKAKLARVERAA